MTSNVTRLEELELRSTASSRVIAQSGASVAFLQGVYGYRERDGSRMLRQVINTGGVPMITPRGRPMLSLEGDGPVVELQFTGTGFLVGEAGLLVTNRHVALPWEQSGAGDVPLIEGVEPVMVRLLGYLPGEMAAVPLVLVQASESADLALLRPQDAGPQVAGLRLAEKLPASGDEVIVMGYPTGLRSMLAQSGRGFHPELQETEEHRILERRRTAGRKGLHRAPVEPRHRRPGQPARRSSTTPRPPMAAAAARFWTSTVRSSRSTPPSCRNTAAAILAYRSQKSGHFCGRRPRDDLGFSHVKFPLPH